MSHCVGCWRTLVSVAADGRHGNPGLHILPGIPTQWNTLFSLTSWRCVCTHTHTQGLFFLFFYSMQTQTRTHTRTLKGFPGCRGVLFLGCIFFFFFAFGHFSLPPLHQKTQVNFFLRRSDISCSNLPQWRYRKLYEYCVHSLTHLNFSLLFFFFFFFPSPPATYYITLPSLSWGGNQLSARKICTPEDH